MTRRKVTSDDVRPETAEEVIERISEEVGRPLGKGFRDGDRFAEKLKEMKEGIRTAETHPVTTRR